MCPMPFRYWDRFNPRTREGATDWTANGDLPAIVSIHAPVRVRPGINPLAQNYSGFNTRTREGATQVQSTQCK